MKANSQTLGDEFPKEIVRVEELRRLYESLPGGVGKPAAFLMGIDIEKAREAQARQDVVEMIKLFPVLQAWEE